MTNKEFAFNYAGKEFMFYGDRVIVVGYDNEYPDVVIVSPASGNARGCFWEGLDYTDVITHRVKRKAYQYAQIKELTPIRVYGGRQYKTQLKGDIKMTSKEFAFNYAGKEFMLDGHRVVLVGYNSERSGTVIASPLGDKSTNPFWWTGVFLESWDVITYKTDIEAYQYANLNDLIFIDDEKPQNITEVKPLTPGECIARYEGCQGMNYSVVNGCVSAMYKRQGSALKLVSRGDSINNVTEKI